MSKKRDAEGSGDWAADLLLKIADDEGQKKRLAALDPAVRASLVDAVRLVSVRKARTYAQAKAGVWQSPDGWIASDPELASATALLNSHFIPVSSVPMHVTERVPEAAPSSAPGEEAVEPVPAAPLPVAQGQVDFGF